MSPIPPLTWSITQDVRYLDPVRMQALSEAIRLVLGQPTPTMNADEVITTATRFERFLEGRETDDQTVRELLRESDEL